MQSKFMALIIVLLMAMPVLGQVDTLELQEISNVILPENIQNIAAARDVNGDSTLELLIQGIHYIYLCNGLTGDIIWTSPDRYYAFNLSLFDMNSDGILDIALQCDSTIQIFDMVNSNLIWMDTLGFRGRYTLGDVNSDGYPDIIALIQARYPSVIYLYNGPAFDLTDSLLVYLDGYDDMEEYCDKISIVSLSSDIGAVNRIVLFTHIYHSTSWFDNPYYCYTAVHSGTIKLVDPERHDISEFNGTGYIHDYTVEGPDERPILYAICDTITSQQSNLMPNYWNFHQYRIALAADTILSSSLIWEIFGYNSMNYYWDGPMIGEFNTNNMDKEICYGIVSNVEDVNDTLIYYSWPDMLEIHRQEAGQFSRILGIFYSQLLAGPQILTRIPITAFDGTTANMTAIILGANAISSIADLDFDGEDELMLIVDNIVHVYHAVPYYSGLDDNYSLTPTFFRLYPAYPNPFNASTTIQYDLVKDSPVNIGIYNILGQRVATLVNQNQPAGHHQVIWNAGGVSSGIYFYKISTGDYSETKKMVLMK